MHLVAKVIDLEISEEEVALEKEQLLGQDSDLAQTNALNRLIDRCLLLHQALASGISITEEEFDEALLESLEASEAEPPEPEQTVFLEANIRRRLIIQKYVRSLCERELPVPDEQLRAFYEDQREIFLTPESVRASHILIRAGVPEAEKTARQLHDRITKPEDFQAACREITPGSAGLSSGDLGWFHRGTLIPEIEKAAFALQAGQISEVFSTRHGYHILLVTDRKPEHEVGFEEIRESLKARLVQLEREFYLIRHLNELRRQYRDQIRILDDKYSSGLQDLRS